MKKTLKKISAFLKRVFKCGCKTRKDKTRKGKTRKGKMKKMRGKIMKGG